MLITLKLPQHLAKIYIKLTIKKKSLSLQKMMYLLKKQGGEVTFLPCQTYHSGSKNEFTFFSPDGITPLSAFGFKMKLPVC